MLEHNWIGMHYFCAMGLPDVASIKSSKQSRSLISDKKRGKKPTKTKLKVL